MIYRKWGFVSPDSWLAELQYNRVYLGMKSSDQYGVGFQSKFPMIYYMLRLSSSSVVVSGAKL